MNDEVMDAIGTHFDNATIEYLENENGPDHLVLTLDEPPLMFAKHRFERLASANGINTTIQICGEE